MLTPTPESHPAPDRASEGPSGLRDRIAEALDHVTETGDTQSRYAVASSPAAFAALVDAVAPIVEELLPEHERQVRADERETTLAEFERYAAYSGLTVKQIAGAMSMSQDRAELYEEVRGRIERRVREQVAEEILADQRRREETHVPPGRPDALARRYGERKGMERAAKVARGGA